MRPTRILFQSSEMFMAIRTSCHHWLPYFPDYYPFTCSSLREMSTIQIYTQVKKVKQKVLKVISWYADDNIIDNWRSYFNSNDTSGYVVQNNRFHRFFDSSGELSSKCFDGTVKRVRSNKFKVNL